MRAFFRTKVPLKQDQMAANTGWKLKQYLPRDTKLRLGDVKQLFLEMRAHP